MSQYGSSIQTAQITTGNVRTTIDPRDTTFPNNKAVNPLGEKYYDNPVLVVGGSGAGAYDAAWTAGRTLPRPRGNPKSVLTSQTGKRECAVNA